MKLIYLTAGAGGMFCGSCMHDNALTRALSDHGWNIQLVPTYTPIRTDEKDVSVDQVLFGGVNVYLQQKIPLLRHVPAFLDRFLDSPWLIRKVTSRAMEMNPTMLGKLALSMLKGKHGNQRKQVKQLCRWIQLANPGLVIFSNILIGGCIESIKQTSGTPVVVTLQGDDVFIDSLSEPYRSQCIKEIQKIVPHVDGFIVQSEFFRDYMADYFSIPLEKFHVTPLGLDVSEFEPFLGRGHTSFEDGRRPTIGYLARLAKEKGFHHLVDAFIELKKRPGTEAIQLKAAGWMGPDHIAYAQAQFKRINEAGLQDDFEYIGSIERNEKLAFLKSIDVLSVPTEFLEPKGIYALEALAAGVPIVMPEHGAFPELLISSKGGLLVPPRDASQLADALALILSDTEMRNRLARAGQSYVHQHRSSQSMAESTSKVIEQITGKSFK